MHFMPIKIVLTLILGVLLMGCETASDGSANLDSGSASGSGSNKVAALKRSDITSRDLGSRASSGGIKSGTQEDLVVNVGDRVFFDTDSFQLTSEARGVLENQAKWLQKNLAVTLSIEGHADERGTREYNLALGERRATSVRDYLIALGVNPDRIQTISYGKERPVDPRSEADAWSKNRRGVSVVK
jgi:peptidoglycan-associated lipoprotein